MPKAYYHQDVFQIDVVLCVSEYQELIWTGSKEADISCVRHMLTHAQGEFSSGLYTGKGPFKYNTIKWASVNSVLIQGCLSTKYSSNI